VRGGGGGGEGERKIPKVYYRLSKWRGKLEPRCGGVLRDEDERWIEGFSKHLVW
jgi:hypothetical protein